MTGTNKKNFDMKRLLSSILAIVMVAAVILGCVGMLAGCAPANNGKNENNENKDKLYENLSAPEYFQALTLNELDGAVDAIASTYGAYGDLTNNYGGKAEISLQVGELILDQLEGTLSQMTGTTMDLSFLANVDLAADIDVTNELTQLKLGLGLSDTQIITLCLLLSKDTLWAGVPDLSETFVELSLGDAAIEMPATITDVMELLPNEDKLSELLNRYLALALKEIDNVERTQTTLELDGLKQNVTQLTTKIYHTDFLDAAKAVLTAVKADQDVKKIIDDFSAYYNKTMADAYAEFDAELSLQWENVDMYAEFTDAVDSALESINKEEIDTENPVTLITYIDADHNIVGNVLTVPESENDALTYYTVTEGNAFKTLVDVKDIGLKVNGAGTTVNGVIDGKYTVSVMDTTFLTVELAKFDTTKKDAVSGTIRLEPSADMLDRVLGGNHMLSMADVALELKLDITEDNSNIEINLVNNDALVVGIALKLGEKTPGALQKPANTVDAMDMEALMGWVSSLDLAGVFANLRTAGVPETLVAAIEMIVPAA